MTTKKAEKSIRLLLSVDLHTKFKMKCVKEGVTMQDKLFEFVSRYVAET